MKKKLVSSEDIESLENQLFSTEWEKARRELHANIRAALKQKFQELGFSGYFQ